MPNAVATRNPTRKPSVSATAGSDAVAPAALATVASTARPTAVPTCWLVLNRPEARPCPGFDARSRRDGADRKGEAEANGDATLAPVNVRRRKIRNGTSGFATRVSM